MKSTRRVANAKTVRTCLSDLGLRPKEDRGESCDDLLDELLQVDVVAERQPEPSPGLSPEERARLSPLGRALVGVETVSLDVINVLPELQTRPIDDGHVEHLSRTIDPSKTLLTVDTELNLVDGNHRRASLDGMNVLQVMVEIFYYCSDEARFNHAVALNMEHNVRPYTREEKKAIGLKWHVRGRTTSEIAEKLAVHEDTVRKWTKSARDKEKRNLEVRVQELVRQGRTQREIADELDIGRDQVRTVLGGNRKKPKGPKAQAEQDSQSKPTHQPDHPEPGNPRALTKKAEGSLKKALKLLEVSSDICRTLRDHHHIPVSQFDAQVEAIKTALGAWPDLMK